MRKFLVLTALAGIVVVAPLLSQSSPQVPATQTANAEWEKAAGGKMSFDVASVKRDTIDLSTGNASENVPLDASDGFTHTGGLFRATNIPLHWYIRFAYKLETTEFGEIMDELPKWALANRYDIEARAPGDPSKDQYRLMMQALLADRFRLAVHFETKPMPIWGLVLNKPGSLGPKLRKHSDDPPCKGGAANGARVEATAEGFPVPCYGFFDLQPGTEGNYAGGARDVSMSRMADIFALGTFQTYKPVVDETGLTGNYDFVIEFSRDPNSAGPAFFDALKDQLGLKLVQQTGQVETIVVDHIEEPTPN
jgi:uncharacterized protein (TIGR03435 family)